MTVSLPSIAVPGQRLGPVSSFIPGPGTHIQDSFVCASIAGPVILQKEGEEEESKVQLKRQQQSQQHQKEEATKKQQRIPVMVARSFAQTFEGSYGAMTGDNINNSKSGSSINRIPQLQKPP
ncbi:hypothetical protein EMPG_10418, partial [Blastomyces silverae]